MEPRDLDPNNPVEAMKRGDLTVPQAANRVAAFDLAVVRLLPAQAWTAISLAALLVLVAVLVYVFA